MTFPLDIPKGVTWAAQWPVLDDDGDLIDVSTWTVNAQVRDTIIGDQLLHEWSNNAGNVELGNGFIRVLVAPDESEAWGWVFGYYDVMLTDPTGDRTKLDEGPVQAVTAVTRGID